MIVEHVLDGGLGRDVRLERVDSIRALAAEDPFHRL